MKRSELRELTCLLLVFTYISLLVRWSTLILVPQGWLTLRTIWISFCLIFFFLKDFNDVNQTHSVKRFGHVAEAKLYTFLSYLFHYIDYRDGWPVLPKTPLICELFYFFSLIPAFFFFLEPFGSVVLNLLQIWYVHSKEVTFLMDYFHNFWFYAHRIGYKKLNIALDFFEQRKVMKK